MLRAAEAPENSRATVSGSPTGDFSIGAEGLGWSPYPLIAQGYRAGYGVNSDFDIELSYQHSGKKILMSELKYTEYALRMVHRPSELFYWGYGMGIRDVSLTYDLFVTSQDDRQAISEHHQALTAVTFVGIEVNPLDHLAVGSDLLGMSAPLSWLKSDNRYPDDAQSYEEDPRDYPYVEKAFALNYQILRTYLRFKF